MSLSFFSFPLIPGPEIEPQGIAVSGHGKKGVGLVINESEHTPDCIQQLSGILSAAGFGLEEDTILFVVPPRTPFSAAAWMRRYALSHLLLFDLDTARAGLVFNLSVNRPVLHAGATLLLAPSLDAILREKAAGGKTLRLGLWQAIQQIFPKP